MKQLRFKYTVASSLFYVLFNIREARRYAFDKTGKYTSEQKYEKALKYIDHMRRRSRTKTVVFGKENLPTDGGYIMYSNHQGKYDALGILLNHDKPCSVLWERKAADRFLAREVCALLNGKKIDHSDLRETIRVLNEVSDEAANGGRFLIFPEGGYDNNKNELQEFKTGCFICSIKSKTPIVPVVIYDSWRAMDTNTFGKVTTEVHYLTPIQPSEYAGMSKAELCEFVKGKISDKLDEIKESKKALA